MCLKIKNCYLKIFVKIRVGEKVYDKCMKCYLKTKNSCLKTQTKHPLSFLKKKTINFPIRLLFESFGLILQNLNLICIIGTVETYLRF